MSRHSRLFPVLLSFACLPILAACSSAPKGASAERAADAAVLSERARSVLVFRGDGAPAAWGAMVDAFADADAVVIGENHGHALGLAFAAEAWADVLARRDRAVLSMEFFNRDEQSRVDDYLSGLWDEAAFVKATNRATPSAYPPGHRAMVEAAKAAGRPVIAANAPRVYVRAASRHGYERLAGLTEDQRRMFRIPDALPTGAYRERYDALMSSPEMASHGGPPKQETPEELRKRLDGGFRSQSLWDWTMAESIAYGLERGTPVVHVVGRFHSDHEGGLIGALRSLRPGVRVVTVSVVDAWAGALREEDRGRADFVAYVGPSEPGK